MSQTIKETTTDNRAANVRFIVAGTQRSGTTLIQTTLDSHPQIFCEGELFQMRRLFRKIPRKSYGQPGYRWWLGGRADRWLMHATWRSIAVRQYLDWFITQSDSPVFGFKLMWNQTERFPGTLKFLEDNGYLLLHIRRRNILRSLVSRFAARARGLHHSTRAVATPLVTLPVHDLLTRLERISTDNINWERLGEQLPYLRIDYEDYVENPTIEDERMLDFLGAPKDVAIKSPLVKVTPNDLRKVIANFDEVAKALKGTEYEAMLEV